jgi:alpha-N-acetylglucosamine transferase
MNNSKKFEKSRGIVAFANNTAQINYVKIAEQTLKVAGHILKLPYTIISDVAADTENKRYDIDTGEFIPWRNSNRYQVYEQSPYDETLVIDADYLILDQNLLKIFSQPWDYLLQRHTIALTQQFPTDMGPNSLPFVWGTVFAFRKTHKSKLFFDLVGRVQNNYGYYRSLFNLQERNYRNDYAFAIADILLNGYSIETTSIPGTMVTVDQVIDSIQIKNNQLVIKDGNRAYVVPRTNLHIMSKAYLQSENFAQLVEQIVNEPT